MKKLKLKKAEAVESGKRIGYKIPYEHELNAAQYEAVMHNNGAALVIAGAGTGKTRTLVYRVARLIEDGVPPESILLLTFTRKAASEMLRRASGLLDGRCEQVSGGTFHSFGLNLLRRHAKAIGYDQSFNVLDQGDSEDVIHLIRSQLKLDKSRRRFPRKNTLQRILSLSINKRLEVEEILEKEYPAFEDYLGDIQTIFKQYSDYKKKYNLMDYDDLLVNLHDLLKDKADIRKDVNKLYTYIMVDEYQDTNRLQHEIVLLLAGEKENVVAVGDDAQSIYGFRGADFQNIMFFPESFSECTVYKIEENYRSTQPILSITNEIIHGAVYKYEKELFTRRTGGDLPMIVKSHDERQQSEFIAQQVLEVREEGVPMDEIAVLFRNGFHSFDLELELNRARIAFRKFGGMKFIETAHIKDVLSFMRVLFNSRDAVSWQRALMLLDGVGPRTASSVTDTLSSGDPFSKNFKIQDIKRGRETINELMKELRSLKEQRFSVGEKASAMAEFYKPILKNRHDDWQKRWKDIETFVQIAERYKSLREFLSDMALEPPLESLAELTPESKEEEFITLSTIHSAKGLEWKVVFLIWALEGRFPSAKAVEDIETLEEERRLFYVACTRAKDRLFITHPANIYDRGSGTILSDPSRFIADISDEIADKFILVDDDEEEDDEMSSLNQN